MAIVVDLDGVIWLGAQPIPGAAAAVARLRRAGHRVLFVTNNSASRVGDVEDKLAAMGIPAHGDVVTSAMAGASLVAPGERVHVIGGPGLLEALQRRGRRGRRRYGGRRGHRRSRHRLRLRHAGRGGHRDPRRRPLRGHERRQHLPDGPRPGAGQRRHRGRGGHGRRCHARSWPASRTTPIAAVVRSIARPRSRTLVMVGDRADTDGRFARALGGRFGLVLSGVTKRADLPVSPAPDLVGDDLADLAAQLGA